MSIGMMFIAIIFVNMIILIHECGHFFMCKYLGLKVFSFNIGMGPIIYSYEYIEIVFCLRAIPMGGYVHIDDVELSESDNITKIFTYMSGSLSGLMGSWLVFSIIYFVGISFPYHQCTNLVWNVLETSSHENKESIYNQLMIKPLSRIISIYKGKISSISHLQFRNMYTDYVNKNCEHILCLGQDGRYIEYPIYDIPIDKLVPAYLFTSVIDENNIILASIDGLAAFYPYVDIAGEQLDGKILFRYIPIVVSRDEDTKLVWGIVEQDDNNEWNLPIEINNNNVVISIDMPNTQMKNPISSEQDLLQKDDVILQIGFDKINNYQNIKQSLSENWSYILLQQIDTNEYNYRDNNSTFHIPFLAPNVAWIPELFTCPKSNDVYIVRMKFDDITSKYNDKFCYDVSKLFNNIYDINIIERHPIHIAVWKGWKQLVHISYSVCSSLVNIPSYKHMSSLVGIVQSIYKTLIPHTNKLVKTGFLARVVHSLYYVGCVSVAMNVVNLLPIPVLDGGIWIWIILEKLFGKKRSLVIYEVLSSVFIVLISVLLAFCIFKDLVHIYKEI